MTWIDIREEIIFSFCVLGTFYNSFIYSKK